MPVHQFSIIRVRIKANVSNVVVYLLTCLRKTVYPKLLWSKPTLVRPGSSLIKKLFHFKVCKISPDMHVNLVTKSKAVNHLCCYKLQENATWPSLYQPCLSDKQAPSKGKGLTKVTTQSDFVCTVMLLIEIKFVILQVDILCVYITWALYLWGSNVSEIVVYLFTCLLETACIKTNTLERKVPYPNPRKYTKDTGSFTTWYDKVKIDVLSESTSLGT